MIRRQPFIVGLLALTLTLPFAGAAAADETYVNVTGATIDQVSYVSRSGELLRLTGTLTCDGVGIIGAVEFSVTQRDTRGSTNSDLEDAPCSTSPTPFAVDVEIMGDEAFKPGRAAAVLHSSTFPTERRIKIKR